MPSGQELDRPPGMLLGLIFWSSLILWPVWLLRRPVASGGARPAAASLGCGRRLRNRHRLLMLFRRSW